MIGIVRVGVAAVVMLVTVRGSLAAENPFAAGVRATPALAPEEERRSFTVPEGFEIQLVASEPEINKPINIAVDARGRLWVTSTVEYPFPVKPNGREPRDAVKVIEVDPATGRATKVTTFADKLNIPAGVYPYRNGTVVFSIPNVWWMQDTDGDGVADKREVLYGPFDTSRDTHGMTNSFTRGYDGFLYATHGFNNQSKIAAKDGSSVEMVSGNVFRMALDGTHVDHITHGPVNPFGLAFDGMGNLYVADCHTKPFQQVMRGAWYEHFGRPHDGLGFYPKIMGHLHGSTAIGGVVALDDARWPEGFRGDLIGGNPMTSRVNRDAVEWSGATPALKEKADLVASTDPWFRPVAFALSPDGSVYVADFYNRIIGHYEVPLTHPGRDRERGRIWRIVPPGLKGARPALTNFADAPLGQLIEALGHPGVSGRLLAINEIVDRFGREAAGPARGALGSADAVQRSGALWVLQRVGALSQQDVEAAAKDSDRVVRVHLMRVLGAGHTLKPEQREVLMAGLRDADALVRRCAVESLALRPAEGSVRPLVGVVTGAPAADTHLVYAARIALRRHFEAPEVFAAVATEQWEKAEVAAINGVLPTIKTAEAAAFLGRQLAAGEVPGLALADAVKHVASYGGDAGAEAAVAFVRERVKGDPDQQIGLLRAVHEGAAQRAGRLSAEARGFAATLAVGLLSAEKPAAGRVTAAAELAKALGLKECAGPLAAVLGNGRSDGAARLAAVRTILALDPGRTEAVVAVVGDVGQPDALREAAAKALVEANTQEARQALILPIRQAPQALAVKLAAALAARPEGAAVLMDAVERNNLSPRLLQAAPVKDKLALAKVKDLDARIASLTRNLTPADAQLDQLIAKRKAQLDLKKGDVLKGLEVFARTCAICHQVDGKGAVVGPQLDGVASRGVERILEDVIDPNRNVDPAFRYTNVTLKDGETVSGLMRGEAGQTITLVDPTGREVKVDKGEVERSEVSKLSLMPTGFGEILSAEEMNNLVAFLMTKGAGR